MKYLFFILLFTVTSISAQYNKYFTDNALRIDFIFSGSYNKTNISLINLIKEPYWGGPKKNTISKFNYGNFRVILQDAASLDTIYLCGFCSLFEEWQSSPEAKKINRGFEHSIQTPFPKNDFIFYIEQKNKKGEFDLKLKIKVDPNDYIIRHNKITTYNVNKLINNAPPENCVDIAIISEGYTNNEMDKFHKDAKRLIEFLFLQEPFKKHKNKFNVNLIDVPSKDSGATDPRKNIWKNTALNASFNTLNSDRYLLTTNVFKTRDIAANVPYDQIYILVNTSKYGGGGIYNSFSLCSSDNKYSDKVFVHEFGHAFSGLGDEYFYGNTEKYEDHYYRNIEVWQPNLTNLVDFDSKWKDMLESNTPIPTPENDKNKNKVGVYEGAGYVAKDVYRPMMDCRMKSNVTPDFCPVCQRAIEKMIIFLTE